MQLTAQPWPMRVTHHLWGLMLCGGLVACTTTAQEVEQPTGAKMAQEPSMRAQELRRWQASFRGLSLNNRRGHVMRQAALAWLLEVLSSRGASSGDSIGFSHPLDETSRDRQSHLVLGLLALVTQTLTEELVAFDPDLTTRRLEQIAAAITQALVLHKDTLARSRATGLPLMRFIAQTCFALATHFQWDSDLERHAAWTEQLEQLPAPEDSGPAWGVGGAYQLTLALSPLHPSGKNFVQYSKVDEFRTWALDGCSESLIAGANQLRCDALAVATEHLQLGLAKGEEKMLAPQADHWLIATQYLQFLTDYPFRSPHPKADEVGQFVKQALGAMRDAFLTDLSAD